MSTDLPLPIPLVPSPALIDPFVIVASSASAISARLCTHPLDTLRIRVQTWPGKVVPPLHELIPRPRVRTLYAGLPVALGFSVPALSIYLSTYEATKRYLGANLLPQHYKPTLLQQLPVFVLSGMAAEFASGALWTPMDVMKARLQRGNEGATTSATALLRKIWKEEGYRGVWRGYWVSMVVFVPYISLYWTLYESFKSTVIPNYDAFASSSLPSPSPSAATAPYTIPLTLKYTLCSVSACSLAACVTNPIELVNSRWQTSGGRATGGVTGIVKELWRQGGSRAFARGLGFRVLYAIPSNGVSMTVYESLKRWKGI